MTIHQFRLSLKTTADTDIIDLTDEVVGSIQSLGVESGLLTLFVPGSTGALTTIEYESGVLHDLTQAIDRIAPRDMHYDHDARWGDGNGYSHVRAALLKPDLHVPIVDGRPTLGTWQQIVLLDFDNKPRTRRVIGQIIAG